MELISKSFEFTKYPVNIFGQGLKIVLSSIIPLGFVAFYPGMVFLGGNAAVYLILAPAQPTQPGQGHIEVLLLISRCGRSAAR
jgi:ABC-type uncharacterized transport system permease subunit